MDQMVFPWFLGDIYVNFIKIGVTILALLGWAAVTQWVDRDTDVVKTKREQWNLLVAGGGLLGFALFLIPPWKGPLFFVGLGLLLLLAGGSQLIYVIHRNGRVVPSAKVLTIAHFKRLLASKEKKKGGESKGLQVRLLNHEGKLVNSAEEDPEEVADFDLVQSFLHDVLWRRASDVDLVQGKDRYRFLYRVDGVTTEKPEGFTLEEGERIFRHLKHVAGLNGEERRKPQEATLRLGSLGREGDLGFLKVHTSGSTAGERLRLQIRGETEVLRIHELGFAPARLEKFKKIIEQRSGLFLISGPRGSGTTTTLYGVLRSHDAYINHIHTLERRTLAELPNITQHIHDRAADVTYGRQLQSILRREPDMVGVGECEDQETARLLAQASGGEEAKKLYAILEAKDSFEAVVNFVKLAGDARLASQALLGVCNQRLVRVLCESCREAFKPDPAKLKKLNLPVDKIDRFHRPPTEPLVDKKGREIICETCQGTGYRGRTAIIELLMVDPEMRQLIAQGASLDKIKTHARRNKMYLLQEEGLFKVIEGKTSLNEIQRALSEGAKAAS